MLRGHFCSLGRSLVARCSFSHQFVTNLCFGLLFIRWNWKTESLSITSVLWNPFNRLGNFFPTSISTISFIIYYLLINQMYYFPYSTKFSPMEKLGVLKTTFEQINKVGCILVYSCCEHFPELQLKFLIFTSLNSPVLNFVLVRCTETFCVLQHSLK